MSYLVATIRGILQNFKWRGIFYRFPSKEANAIFQSRSVIPKEVDRAEQTILQYPPPHRSPTSRRRYGRPASGGGHYLHEFKVGQWNSSTLLLLYKRAVLCARKTS